jgi:hypothetical protein
VRQAVSLRDLYELYSDRVQFLVVYIREAHAVDGWDIGSDNRVHDPTTIHERRAVAGQCEAAMAYGIRTYVDEIDDPVMTAYAAWPERLYLVDAEGGIVYAGGQGPGCFSPEELQHAIDAHLSQETRP